MIKVIRFFAICTIGIAFATLSTASAQTYTQIDYPNAITTEIDGGPNLEGTSVGSWVDTNGVFHGFSLTANGVFQTFDPPGSAYTTPGFINNQGVIVGVYLDSSSVSHGFIFFKGKYTVVNVAGAAGTTLSGINDLNEISGATCTDPACGLTGNSNTSESFVKSRFGDYDFFNPPGATSSQTSSVSLAGAVVGDYTNAESELSHGYLLFQGEYSTIDFPGARYGTFAGGGNVANDVVGIYNYAGCTADCDHAFELRKGVYTSFDFPGATTTEATGINASGVIVGIFMDSSNNFHGFIRTPGD
jgi:hypothetical protein